MAKPKFKRPSKGLPPQQQDKVNVVANNTSKHSSSELVTLNFKVDSELHKEFKMFATMHSMTMVDLFKQSFEEFKKERNS